MITERRRTSRDFMPIAVGKVAPAPTHIPAPLPQPLELSRVQPDYDGMDDLADYAQTLPNRVEPLEGMLIVECPEASHG